MKKTDPIVEGVIQDLRERSKRGIEKYGTTLSQNNQDDFLQHLYEELLDAACYTKKLQKQKQQKLLCEIIKEDEKDGLYSDGNGY